MTSTTVTTQVNNDFCNTCNEISDTNNISYHNLIKRYDNKFDSSIDNIIGSERFNTIGAIINTDYLNISFVERFSTIGATVNQSMRTMTSSSSEELYSTNGETSKTSYQKVIEEESYNNNRETPEETATGTSTTSSTIGFVV